MVETRLLYTYAVFLFFMIFLINSGINVFAEDFNIEIPTMPQNAGFVETGIQALNYVSFYFHLLTLNSTFLWINFIIFLPLIVILGYILLKDIIIPILQAIAEAIPF